MVEDEVSSPTQKLSQEEEESDPKYSAWMLVTRKKSLVRNGRGCGMNQYNQHGDKLAKGNLGHSGPLNEEVGPSTLDSAHDSPRKTPNAELEGKKNAELKAISRT